MRVTRFAPAMVVMLSAVGLANARALSFQDRVKAQEAIERVYWERRIWPKENPQPKPPLEEFLPRAAIEGRVEDYLRKSNLLLSRWGRSITARALQAELVRIGRNTRDPQMLRRLMASLGRDPFMVAECLARPLLVDRLAREEYARDERIHGLLRSSLEQRLDSLSGAELDGLETQRTVVTYRLGFPGTEARSSSVDGDDDRVLDTEEWNRFLLDLAIRFGHQREPAEAMLGPSTECCPPGASSPWEHVVAGSSVPVTSIPLDRPSRLREETDGYSAVVVLSRAHDSIQIANLCWPKRSFDSFWETERTGFSVDLEVPDGHYDLVEPNGPGCQLHTWRPIYRGAPTNLYGHSSVWTGTEMIVWGGIESHGSFLNTGARFDPSTDTWTPMSVKGAPSERWGHSSVWTGTHMLVWGGRDYEGLVGDGARYDPANDFWEPISSFAAPAPRSGQSTVWTGSAMIVWGGHDGQQNVNSGARYDPAADRWSPTSRQFNVPMERYRHTAVWSGSEMLVWGGITSVNDQGIVLNTGVRYDPEADSWAPMST